MRTFVPVRRTITIVDGVEVAVGATALVVACVVDDYPVGTIALELPVFAAIYVGISRMWENPELENVLAMPPGAVVGRRRAGWRRLTVAFLALGLLIAFLVLGDALARVIAGCILVASPVERAISRRTIAKWEAEHGLELLRERRQLRGWRTAFGPSQPYYVRPRRTEGD